MLLPGFGTSELDLEKTNWRQWAAGAEKALDTLTARYKKVYIVGFSMGGSIALHLAARHKVAGVILLAPCIYINGQSRLITPEYAIKHLAQFMATDYIINDKMRAFDFSAMKDRPYYHLFPINSLKELVGLEETARGEIGEVEEPVIIIQSVNDRTVDKSGPAYLVNHLPRKDAEVVWVERSMHLLALDAERTGYLRKPVNSYFGISPVVQSGGTACATTGGITCPARRCPGHLLRPCLLHPGRRRQSATVTE